jgi:Autotransporter beta-domain
VARGDWSFCVVNASTAPGSYPKVRLAEECKGFALKKQVLLLSVAVTALSMSQAFAQTDDPVDDITTAITTPVATATANPDGSGTPADILLDTGGSITVSTSGTQTVPQAAVTINSNNSFSAVEGTTISNNNTDMGVGIMADLTAADIDATNDGGTCTTNCHTFEGITEAGAITLTGTGTDKVGLYLEGADPTTATTVHKFIGNIDMTGSTITITGDGSAGVKIDSLAELDGNLTLGTMVMKPTDSSSTGGFMALDVLGAVNGDITSTGSMTLTANAGTAAGALIGFNIAGAVAGNVTLASGSVLDVVGTGSEGILLTGNISACNMTVQPACTSVGSLINQGTIVVLGVGSTVTANTGNQISSSAVAIGASIAGGIYNSGATFLGDTTTPVASISSQGVAPTVNISVSLETATAQVPLVIGVYSNPTTPDPDPGFSFYNRGSISVGSSNSNDSTQAIFISGATTINSATLAGGLFNSGTIQAVARTLTGNTVPTDAVAISIGKFADIGPDDTYKYDPGNGGIDGFVYQNNSGNASYKSNPADQAALVNSGETGSGRIIAAVGGASPAEADAIEIAADAMLPSIINSGLISAVATSTDTTISSLIARGIVDNSGTLTFIENNGTIAAATTTLDNDAQVAIAIDLRADGENTAAAAGVLVLDQATANSAALITGSILFGSGDNQTVDVEGFSTDDTATINGDITFGGGTALGMGSDQLIIGDFGTVTGIIKADPTQGVSVDIRQGGVLNLLNNATSGALTVAQNATTNEALHVETGGTLNLTVYQEFQSGIINSSGQVTFDPGALLNITYGSFIGQTSNFVLISGPANELNLTTNLTQYQSEITAKLPFLFDPIQTQLTVNEDVLNASGQDVSELLLTVVPKNAAALGFAANSYAAQLLPLANAALANDDILGAAFVNGITNEAEAKRAYTEAAPDVSGGVRAIAVALTDQSSGPVAARQRMLRMYGKQDGEITLWGQEFAEFVDDPGNRSTGQTGFKDHGFGFVLGIDGGDPKTGWYGGAFSFYSGDIVEPYPRDSHDNTLWYMFTGYTDWRGKGLFLDTKADIGYVDVKTKRFIDLTLPSATGGAATPFQDEADGHSPGLVGALGLTTGAILAYGSTTITPQISVDGMAMREEGYTETHPDLLAGTSATGNGKGMDLMTQPYYAQSLRAFVGSEFREDLNFGDFFVQPDLRLGYRYDFLNDPTKLKFAYAFGNSTGTGPGQITTLEGPDPAQGNVVAGASISATTDAWTLGANYDFVRGTNGATTQIGTIHLLGRI